MSMIQISYKNLAALILLVMLACTDSYAQTDTTEREITFHIAKKPKCGKQPKLTDLQQAGLRGQVKRVITQEYVYEGSKGGNKSVLYSTTTDKYDSAGVLLGSVTDYPNSQYQLTQARTFNKTRHLIKEVFERSDKWSFKELNYTYDTDGRLTTIVTKGYTKNDGSNKKLPYTFISRYNTLGNCIYDESFEVTNSYKYDSNGYCTEKIATGVRRPDIFVKIQYEYGLNCKVQTQISKLVDTVVERCIYAYNDKDIVIEKSEEHQTDTTLTSYKFDEKGSRIKYEEITRGSKRVHGRTYTYIYDQKDNWTQKEEYEGDREKGYLFRQIFYY